MSNHATSNFAPRGDAQATLTVAAVVRRLARLCTSAFAWLKDWAAADAARQQLEMMNDRELLDIGMTRVDVRRVARGAPVRDEPDSPGWF